MSDFSHATELAIREAIAASDPTPHTVTISGAAWHPSCGVVMQMWNEPHPAAVAEEILRAAIA